MQTRCYTLINIDFQKQGTTYFSSGREKISCGQPMPKYNIFWGVAQRKKKFPNYGSLDLWTFLNARIRKEVIFGSKFCAL